MQSYEYNSDSWVIEWFVLFKRALLTFDFHQAFYSLHGLLRNHQRNQAIRRGFGETLDEVNLSVNR